MYFRTRIVFPCILNHDKLARQSLRNKASVFNGKYCWLVIFRSSLMFLFLLFPRALYRDLQQVPDAFYFVRYGKRAEKQ